jgi:hypothetical protein
MTQLRQSRWISTLLVAVIAFAWIVASNHCALAAIEGMRKPAHACCREGAQSHLPPMAAMQCCDTLHATIFVPAAAPEGQLHALQPAWLEIAAVLFSELARPRAEFHATGPPRALGFAEIVLNRSLLSHAPPRFVA